MKALNAPEAGLINDDDPKAEDCPKTEDVAGRQIQGQDCSGASQKHPLGSERVG